MAMCKGKEASKTCIEKVAVFGYFLLDKAQRAEMSNIWVTGKIVILFNSDKEDS